VVNDPAQDGSREQIEIEKAVFGSNGYLRPNPPRLWSLQVSASRNYRSTKQVVESSIPPGFGPHPIENEPVNRKSRGDPINFHISGQASRAGQKSPDKTAENIYHQNDHVIGHRTRLAPSRFCCSYNRSPIPKANRHCYWMDKSVVGENRGRSHAWSFRCGAIFCGPESFRPARLAR
jgi:hypothetical protein